MLFKFCLLFFAFWLTCPGPTNKINGISEGDKGGFNTLKRGSSLRRKPSMQGELISLHGFFFLSKKNGLSASLFEYFSLHSLIVVSRKF